jgi:hypothetical protein
VTGFDASQIIPALAILFGTGGVAASVVALVKVQPETTRVIIASAKGAVVVQREVIENLNVELERVNEALVEERRTCDERLAAQDRKIELMENRLRELERR